MNRLLLFFLCMILYTGCADVGQCKMEIKVDSLSIHLVVDERYHQDVPPQLYFRFSVLELNNRLKPYILSDKHSSSEVFIVDTLNNHVIPIVLGSTVIEISSDSSSYFMGYINIDEHVAYFGLDPDYFYRIDYLNEKDFLREKCITMLNNSMLVYTQIQDIKPNSTHDIDKNNCMKSSVIYKHIYSVDDIKID